MGGLNIEGISELKPFKAKGWKIEHYEDIFEYGFISPSGRYYPEYPLRFNECPICYGSGEDEPICVHDEYVHDEEVKLEIKQAFSLMKIIKEHERKALCKLLNI